MLSLALVEVQLGKALWPVLVLPQRHFVLISGQLVVVVTAVLRLGCAGRVGFSRFFLDLIFFLAVFLLLF